MIAILASVSFPPYLQYLNHARGSEAVSTMIMIRQSLRDFNINNNALFDIEVGNIPNDLPTSVVNGIPSPSTAGVQVDAKVAHYFSDAAYSVDATSPSSARFANPNAVDFIILVNGTESVACGSSNCATDAAAVSKYRLEMDNTDRAFISYDSGTNWSRY